MVGAHGRKLVALFQNSKLPKCDKDREAEIMAKYKAWRKDLDNDSLSAEEYLKTIVEKTNEYKNFIDIDFIFSSQDSFLYRQAGQLKLNNSILEECMACLFDKRLIPGAFIKSNSFGGDVSCYAGLSFGTWNSTEIGDRVFIKKKDQDFSIGKVINLTIEDGAYKDKIKINIAYFATEIKTNLDKTMFQEASATARELKTHVAKSRYYLLCEWLDMTPIDSSTTSIDSVIVLRKAKRLSSEIRARFNTVEGRRNNIELYSKYVKEHPLCLDMFQYIIDRANEEFPVKETQSDEMRLSTGVF